MRERFIHGEGIHLSAVLVTSGLNGCLQEMARNLNGERIGDDTAGSPVVLHPYRMRQCYPDRTSIHQEFNVHGISMASGHGHNQGLIHSMEFVAGPAVGCVKVL